MERTHECSFSFDNTARQLFAVVSAITAFVEERVTHEVLLKVKLVSTELLTNAIKHSGRLPTTITIGLDNTSLTISKHDGGEPFKLISDGISYQWPLPGRHQSGRTFTIYKGIGSVLTARAIDNQSVDLYTEDIEDTTSLNELSEHFGLMIVARASDSFTYTFDVDSCRNVFKSVIALNI